jgi:transcriptional regulator with XRE-family HTH domain
MDQFKNRVKYAIDKVGNATILAKKTGITRQAIGSYAAGDTDPTREKLILIADAADIHIEWLVAGRGPRDIGQVSLIREEDVRYAGEAPDEIKVSNLLTKTAEVLEADPVYRQVLAAGINALYRSVFSDKHNRETMARLSQLEEKLEEAGKRNEEIEKRMILLEEKTRPSSAGQSDGDDVLNRPAGLPEG